MLSLQHPESSLNMGKGLDTCLAVQPMAVQTADPTEVVITQRKKKLVQMMTASDPSATNATTALIRQVHTSRLMYTERFV